MEKAVHLLSSFGQLTFIQNKVSSAQSNSELPNIHVIKHCRGNKNIRGRIPRQPGLDADNVRKIFCGKLKKIISIL